MNRIVVASRLDSNGILNLTLPVSPSDANQEVQITVDPVDSAPLAPDEWRRRILETAGKWQGDLERPATRGEPQRGDRK